MVLRKDEARHTQLKLSVWVLWEGGGGVAGGQAGNARGSVRVASFVTRVAPRYLRRMRTGSYCERAGGAVTTRRIETTGFPGTHCESGASDRVQRRKGCSSS